MQYLPRRYTPTSSLAKSSKAGSVRGGLAKSALDRNGTLMSSMRQGLFKNQNSPGLGGDDLQNSSSILLTGYNYNLQNK